MLEALAAMRRLQDLRLKNVLPEASPNTLSASAELSSTLRKLVTVSTISSLNAGFAPLLERSPCPVVVFVIIVGEADESSLTPIVRNLFKVWDGEAYPAVELNLFNRAIVMGYANPRPRPLWRMRVDQPEEFILRTGSSRRCLQIGEVQSNAGRNCKLYPYVRYLPMRTLQCITISSTMAMVMFPNMEAWIETFRSAVDVRRFMVSYRRVFNLFLALAVLSDSSVDDVTHASGNSRFTLFPRLQTLVLHDGLSTRKDDISLVDLLHVREANGTRLQELMVEENLLLHTAIWDSIQEATTVTYFEACTMEQAQMGT